MLMERLIQDAKFESAICRFYINEYSTYPSEPIDSKANPFIRNFSLCLTYKARELFKVRAIILRIFDFFYGFKLQKHLTRVFNSAILQSRLNSSTCPLFTTLKIFFTPKDDPHFVQLQGTLPPPVDTCLGQIDPAPQTSPDTKQDSNPQSGLRQERDACMYLLKAFPNFLTQGFVQYEQGGWQILFHHKDRQAI